MCHGGIGCIPPSPLPPVETLQANKYRLNAGSSFSLFWFDFSFGDCKDDDDKERTLYLLHATLYATFYSSQSLFLLYLNGKVGRFSIFSLSAATVVMSLPQKRKRLFGFVPESVELFQFFGGGFAAHNHMHARTLGGILIASMYVCRRRRYRRVRITMSRSHASGTF